MNTKNRNQTMGAYAPTKKPVFSINVVEKGAQIKYVDNAPQQEQIAGREIRRVRGD